MENKEQMELATECPVNLVHAFDQAQMDEARATLRSMVEDSVNAGRGISKTELIQTYLRLLGVQLEHSLPKVKPPKEKTDEDYIRLHEAAHKRVMKNLKRAAQWQGKR